MTSPKSDSELKALADFKLRVEIQVAWSDMDIFKHVNNANYFKYFEASRVRYFEKIGVQERFADEESAPVLSFISCNFMIPLVYPERILIGARVPEVGKDEICMEHFILNSHKNLAAVGESRLVIFDFRKKRRSLVPDFLKNAIEEFEL